MQVGELLTRRTIRTARFERVAEAFRQVAGWPKVEEPLLARVSGNLICSIMRSLADLEGLEYRNTQSSI